MTRLRERFDLAEQSFETNRAEFVRFLDLHLRETVAETKRTIDDLMDRFHVLVRHADVLKKVGSSLHENTEMNNHLVRWSTDLDTAMTVLGRDGESVRGLVHRFCNQVDENG